MTPKERSEHAKRLLADPVLQDAFSDVRENLVRALENVGFGDVDAHHHSALSLQLLQRLRFQLRKYLETAAIEERREQEATFQRKLLKSIGFP